MRANERGKFDAKQRTFFGLNEQRVCELKFVKQASRRSKKAADVCVREICILEACQNQDNSKFYKSKFHHSFSTFLCKIKKMLNTLL